MSKTYKTKAIIISKKDLGEADKLITCYSDRFGKIKLKGIGMRRQESKMAGHTEQFNLVDLEIVKGRTFDIIIGASRINDFLSLKKNLNFLAYAYYFSELIDKLCETGSHEKHLGAHEENEEIKIFNLLFECLVELDQGPPILDWLASYFEIKLLKILGYGPEMNVCVGCRNNFTLERNFFSGRLGGILCRQCESKDMIASDISNEAIKAIRFLLSKNLESVKRLKISDSLALEIKKISDYFVSFIVDRELKSRRFLGNFLAPV